jgi:hypothetical protein
VKQSDRRGIELRKKGVDLYFPHKASSGYAFFPKPELILTPNDPLCPESDSRRSQHASRRASVAPRVADESEVYFTNQLNKRGPRIDNSSDFIENY